MRTTLLTAVAVFAILLLNNQARGADLKGVVAHKPPKMPKKPGKEELDKSRRTPVGGKTFDQWKSDLTSTDPAVVENAIRTIILYGPDLCKETLEPLVLKLKKARGPYGNLDVSIKVNVILFIGMIGLTDEWMEDGVDCLGSLVNDEQAIVRLQAALTLGQIGSDARKAIPKLLYRLKDPATWEVRKACARALATVAQPLKDNQAPESKVIEALRSRALNDNCFQVRLEAVQSLISLGPPGPANERKSLLRDLKSLADREVNFRIKKKEDETVRLWAQVAIMRMDKIEKKRLDFIGKLLGHPILGVRCQAARALGVIGEEAGPEVPYLIPAVTDKDPIMVGWAVWALANIGRKAREALPDLKELARSTKDEGFKLTVEDAITAIKTPKKMAKEDIKKPVVKPEANAEEK